jgi:hypothetical protein
VSRRGNASESQPQRLSEEDYCRQFDAIFSDNSGDVDDDDEVHSIDPARFMIVRCGEEKTGQRTAMKLIASTSPDSPRTDEEYTRERAIQAEDDRPIVIENDLYTLIVSNGCGRDHGPLGSRACLFRNIPVLARYTLQALPLADWLRRRNCMEFMRNVCEAFFRANALHQR